MFGRGGAGNFADDPPCPHHHDAGGASHSLAKLVGDQDQSVTVVGQLQQDLEQTLRLLRREDLARFVEDQHARPGEQLLEDLHLLLVADREAADRQREIDAEAQPLGERAHAAADVFRIDRPGQVLEEQRHVLPDAERRDQAEVLEHHPDAEPSRVARRSDRDGSA